MSSCSIIRLKKGGIARIRDFDVGEAYPYIREFLDTTAGMLGLRSPKTFEYDSPEYCEELGIPEDVAADLPQPSPTQVEWHEPSEGLVVFKRLLEHVRSLNADELNSRLRASGARGLDPMALTAELEAFQKILERAINGKDMFRIEAAA